MALTHAFGVVHWLSTDTVGTTYTVNLPAGFNLKAIRFYTVGINSATDAESGGTSAVTNIGFATGTAARRCVGNVDFDNNDFNACGSAIRNDCVAMRASSDGTINAQLDITTFSGEQFILTVDDDTTQSMTVGWDAWGGSDITVATVIDFAEPAATGVQSYTVTGFTAAATDQVVMLAGCNVTAALNTAHDIGSALYVGYCTGSASANNIVVAGNNEDGAASSDADGYAQTGECLAMIPALGGNPNARAIGSFDTDAFKLDWLERATTGRKSIGLCIKGGQWAAGAYTINASGATNTATVSGLAFQPIGINFLGGGPTAQNTNDTASAGKTFSFGSASSPTSRQTMTMRVGDTRNFSEVCVGVHYDHALFYLTAAAAIDSEYDLDAITSGGFRVIVDATPDIPSSTEWQGYLAFAGAVGGGAPPFRRSSFQHMLVR